MLLRYGADAKAGNNQKQTPLAFAMAQGVGPRPANTKGYSSTYLAMGFANVRAGTRYPPEH